MPAHSSTTNNAGQQRRMFMAALLVSNSIESSSKNFFDLVGYGMEKLRGEQSLISNLLISGPNQTIHFTQGFRSKKRTRTLGLNGWGSGSYNFFINEFISIWTLFDARAQQDRLCQSMNIYLPVN